MAGRHRNPPPPSFPRGGGGGVGRGHHPPPPSLHHHRLPPPHHLDDFREPPLLPPHHRLDDFREPHHLPPPHHHHHLDEFGEPPRHHVFAGHGGGAGPPPAPHVVAALEERLGAEIEEAHVLLGQNQRLAATHVALVQEVSAVRHELGRTARGLAAAQEEGELRLREVRCFSDALILSLFFFPLNPYEKNRSIAQNPDAYPLHIFGLFSSAKL
jgi:hypothetical protein